MSKNANGVIRKLAAAFLALVMVAGVLPAAALAAGSDPPDWNFLVLFVPMDADYEENGTTKYVKTTISGNEVNTLISQLVEFESVMIESGVMTPHFRNLQLSAPITKLSGRVSHGPYPTSEDVAAVLKRYAIDLDAYDHVFVFGKMDGVEKSYGGITPREIFDNGTTYTFLSAEYLLLTDFWNSRGTPKRPAYVILHEFLHTLEVTCGYSFDLHGIEDEIVPGYQTDEKYKACMLDIILNRVNSQHGSGVFPSAWSYSMRKLRTLREFTIPEDVATVTRYQFKNYTNLERVVIPSTVTSIQDHAFQFCTGLTEVTLPSSISSIEEGTFEQCTALREITIPTGVTSIGAWAFESCGSLKKITIPASVTSIGDAAFQHTGLTDVYYGGTEDQWKAISIGAGNTPLTGATVHYNSPMLSSNKKSVELAGSNLPAGTVVFAAHYAGGRMTDVLSGTLSGSTGSSAKAVTFQRELDSGWRLFFLDADAKTPLCPQITLP